MLVFAGRRGIGYCYFSRETQDRFTPTNADQCRLEGGCSAVGELLRSVDDNAAGKIQSGRASGARGNHSRRDAPLANDKFSEKASGDAPVSYQR